MDKGRERWHALDALRGLAILLMLPVNAAMDFSAIPAWFKHAPASGLTMADFIMPAFLFSLGLSSSLSLKGRLARDGLLRTTLHGLLRHVLLFAFGLAGYFLVWHQGNWEILQMLGLTGALAFPFLFLPPAWRLLSAATFLAAVESLRPAFFGPAFTAWYQSGIGGPWGTVPLAAIPIAASALGEALRARPWPWRAAAAGLAGLVLTACGGLAAALLAPFDKHLLSLSYVLFTTGAASLALAALEAATHALRDSDFPLLGPLGRNPLLAYMAGGVLTLCLRAVVPAGASAGLAWLSSLAVLGLIAGLCAFLDARKSYLRL